MKVKNNLFDNKIIIKFGNVLAIIELISSFIFIFADIPEDYKIYAGIIFFILLIITYIIIWFISNIYNNIKLNINNSKIEIKYGDIFEEKGKKVITFNEYFDTCVDDNIINQKSINGQFIMNKITDTNEFDNYISNELNTRNKKFKINNKRLTGKKNKFELGTTIKYQDEFLLTAFTKFNSNNNAEISMQEYINFLLELWNELDILYSQDIVVIPLLGAGVTRFRDYNVTEQELLELILWTFKISKIKFTYPSKLCIIIHNSLKDKINLYKIKEEY